MVNMLTQMASEVIIEKEQTVKMGPDKGMLEQP
jgi:hypothetical protein